MTFTHLDLFSGIGGFALAASWVWPDHEIVGFCEIDPFCQKVLKKHWPDVPVFDDIKKLKGSDFGTVDLISGGFPCQDLSVCGHQKGINAERSGLWSEYWRVIRETKPKWVVVENVSNLLSGEWGSWFGIVLRDLASVGYNAEWHLLPASLFGAPHHRKRVWIVANPNSEQLQSLDIQKSIRAYQKKPCRRQLTRAVNAAIPADDYAEMRGNYDGVSRIMDRLRSLGNSIVPQVAEQIFKAIKEADQ